MMLRHVKQLCNPKYTDVGKYIRLYANDKVLLNSCNSMSRNQIKFYHSEYKAVVNLLARSLDLSPCTIRRLHTSRNVLTSKNVNGDREGGSTGSSGSQDSNKNGKEGNDNDGKVKSLLTKALLWMFAVYMLVVFLSFIITPRAERPEV